MTPHLPPDEAIVAGLVLVGALIAVWWLLQ